MLNSFEHEVLNAHKYKIIKKFGFFKVQISLECYFSIFSDGLTMKKFYNLGARKPLLLALDVSSNKMLAD